MVITDELPDLINAIQANDQKSAEINRHQMQAKNLNNDTSESSDRNKCEDIYPGSCPSYTEYCKIAGYQDWMKKYCKKTCGYCPGEGT